MNILCRSQQELKNYTAERDVSMSLAQDFQRQCRWQIMKVGVFLEIYFDNQPGFMSSDIPPVPHVKLKPNEFLLLTVNLPDYDEVVGFRNTIEAWWDFLKPQSTFGEKWCLSKLKNDHGSLRLTSGAKYIPGIRWVIFDPTANSGKSAQECWDMTDTSARLATNEVLMAATLLPDLMKDWKKRLLLVNMAGYQFYRVDDWDSTVYLGYWDNIQRLKLGCVCSSMSIKDCVSPTVRDVLV
jgi:hypothetical protein